MKITDGCCDDCSCNCATSGCCPGCVTNGMTKAAFSRAMMSMRRNLSGTVGVSPGTYTIQMGAPPCPADPPNVNSWDLYYGRNAMPAGMIPIAGGFGPRPELYPMFPLNGAPAFGGVRLDILAGVAVLAVGAVAVLAAFAK